MFGNNNQANYKQQTVNTPKSYMNYVNFRNTNQMGSKQIQREPDHVAIYSLIPNSKPTIPISTTPTINRNPYLNGSVDPRKDPPKQNLSRNSRNKQPPMAMRQSQELIRNKAQSNSVNSSKTFNNNNSSISKKKSSDISILNQMGSPYSQTVDLGAISRNTSITQSLTQSFADQSLRQKIQYLQTLQQSLREYEKYQHTKILKDLNENNRFLFIRYLQEINRLKDERQRKTVSDCYSQSDNMSEDALSVDERSDKNRDNSLRIQAEKPKIMEGISRSREKSRQKQNQLKNEQKINEKLQRELDEINQNQRSYNKQLEKIEEQRKNMENQSVKLIAKNKELQSKLKGLPFYQQWMVMCEQSEGAKKTSLKLKEQLTKRKEHLKEINQKLKNPESSVFGSSRQSSEIPFRQNEKEFTTRQDSTSKNRLLTMRMQTLTTTKNQQNSQGQSFENRIIQDSSLRIMGASHQNRSKSSNRK